MQVYSNEFSVQSAYCYLDDAKNADDILFATVGHIFKVLQSLGPIIGAAVFLPQLDNNNNNKLANQKIEMLAFPASSLGGLLRR